MKVVFTGGSPEWVHTELKAAGHEAIDVPANEYVDQEKFAQEINEYDVYVSGGIEDCSRAVIDAAENLKAIMFLGVDYKAYIDADAAQEKDIPIINTPGANARAVAEMNIALILMAARKIPAMLKDLNTKKWQGQNGFEVQGKTLGIIGSGPIAKHVANMAEGIGLTVLYHSRSGEKSGMAGIYCAFDDLLEKSDIVSLNIPKESGVVIDGGALSKMKNSAVLVSTAPATLVDAEALYEALRGDQISAAAFDCFYAEGDKAWECNEAKLMSLGADKFFMTPHAGFNTKEASDNMFRIVVDAIKAL